jgi:hypothetical protein
MKYRRSEYYQGKSDLNGVKDGPSMDMFFQREIVQHSIDFMN